MKTNFKYFICSILMIIGLGYSMEANAQTKVKIDGINYSLEHGSQYWDDTQYVDYYDAIIVASDAFDYAGNIIIPETVTYEGITYPVREVGNSAFEDCTELTSVVLPNNVTSIGHNAFQNCTGLTSVHIPEKVTYIGNSAFYGCTSIKNIELPDGIIYINSECFYNCSSLETIKLPVRLKQIYHSSFYNCSSLRSCTIPDSVTWISYSAFRNCNKLKTVRISDLKAYCDITFDGYDSSPFNNGADLYLNNQKVTDLVIPENIITLSAFAFNRCTSITSVTIPNPTKIIEKSAFESCPNLRKVSLPKSIRQINDYAFQNCTHLEETHIEDLDAFLTKVKFGQYDANPLENGAALYVNDELVTHLQIPATVSEIRHGVLSGCTSITDVTIPTTVTNIGTDAFRGCTNLKSVHTPNLAAFLNIDLEGANSSPLSLPDAKLFENGKVITNLVVPAEVSTIKPYTFANNSSLTAVTLHKGITSVDKDAFRYDAGNAYFIRDCISSIDTLYVEDLAAFYNIDFANAYSNPLYHKAVIVNKGQVLNEINVPATVTDIKPYTFCGVEGINKIILHEGVKSIGASAFSRNNSPVIIKSVTPPTVADEITNGAIIVPSAALSTYMAADMWSEWKDRIYPDNSAYTVVQVAANDNNSDLVIKAGEKNLPNIFNLKVVGSINSYDIMAIRNNMTRLKELDLSEVSFVECNKPYYENYTTRPETITPYMFYDQQFNKIILPQHVKRIESSAFANNDSIEYIELPAQLQNLGDHAFYDCDQLKRVKLHEQLQRIGNDAFYSCWNLKEIIIPNGVTLIDGGAFGYCRNLSKVEFSKNLKEIGYSAFIGCHNLKVIKLPTSLERINGSAFSDCYYLEEVRIPSSIRYIGESAFSGCNDVKKVYTYTIEPTTIQQNTFSCWETATLYIPTTSYWTYFFHTQWGQFPNKAEFDEPYDNFYLEGDLEMSDTTSRVDGIPDVEMGDNSGLIVDGNEQQKTDTLEIEHNGENGGSIIGGNGNGNGGGNIHANKLLVYISVQGGRWYFFSFPFRVPKKDVWCKHTKDFVFRYYDGDKRANNQPAWMDEDDLEDFFDEDEGYIFQCAKSDTLVVCLDNITFNDDDDAEDLMEYLTEDLQNASWNFKGNPFLSYYNIKDMDYDAPITVWNGHGYEAYNPKDDDYILAPFEAFFVQKPTSQNQINFSGQKKSTYHQSQRTLKAAKAKRLLMKTNPSRLLTNLTISNGKQTDQTRIVFNDKSKMSYELECDAAKFMSNSCAAQIYSIDANQAKYAINERPNGDDFITIGYTAKQAGSYTIAAPRLDVPMYLRDEVEGITFDLRLGDYTFTSDAGTFNNRFALVKNSEPTSIQDLLDKTGVELIALNGELQVNNSNDAHITVYNMGGQAIANQEGDGYIQLAKGNYVVKVGGLAVKVSMK